MSTDERANVTLGIVCPMADEAASCEAFVDAVLSRSSGFRARRMLVVTDRATTPATREALERARARCGDLAVVFSPENRGVADAYLAGFRAALADGADWVLEIDAGFSHDPAHLPDFFRALEAGNDCVFGSRFSRGGKLLGSPWHRRLLSRGGTLLANLLLGTRLADMTSGYELFRRPVVEALLARPFLSRGHFFQTEVRAYCRRLRCQEVGIVYRAPSGRVGLANVANALVSLARLAVLRLRGRL